MYTIKQLEQNNEAQTLSNTKRKPDPHCSFRLHSAVRKIAPSTASARGTLLMYSLAYRPRLL